MRTSVFWFLRSSALGHAVNQERLIGPSELVLFRVCRD